MKSYYVYILSNKHRTVLYTGITSRMVERLEEHRAGKGSIFTSRYRVHDLVYFEQYSDPREAIYREKVIKRWGRRKKLALIRSLNPNLEALYVG